MSINGPRTAPGDPRSSCGSRPTLDWPKCLNGSCLAQRSRPHSFGKQGRPPGLRPHPNRPHRSLAKTTPPRRMRGRRRHPAGRCRSAGIRSQTEHRWMPPSPAGSAAAVADRSPACRDRAERVAAESASRLGGCSGVTNPVGRTLPRPLSRAKTINMAASRLPLSAQLPAHPEILVLQGPIAKPPSRPPKDVMSSESPEPDVYNCPH